MLPTGPRRDAFASKLKAELDAFIAESEQDTYENLLRGNNIYRSE
jgi:hypothetical protein